MKMHGLIKKSFYEGFNIWDPTFPLLSKKRVNLLTQATAANLLHNEKCRKQKLELSKWERILHIEWKLESWKTSLESFYNLKTSFCGISFINSCIHAMQFNATHLQKCSIHNCSIAVWDSVKPLTQNFIIKCKF